MNCFEARKEFVSFWRRTMPPDDRGAFSAHLRGCAQCDRSFRVFALTAPALHSEAEPDADAGIRRPAPVRAPIAVRRSPKPDAQAGHPWRAMSAAFVMAAAAVLALYVAQSPRISFEDAMAVDNPSVEPASYTTPENVFGQEVLGQDANLQEPVYNESAANDGFAG